MNKEMVRKNESFVEDEDSSVFMYVLTSIYMYLFIVVLAIVMTINSMASNWEKDIMGSITVQVLPIEDESKHVDTKRTQAQIDNVLHFMENVSGVEEVRLLDTQTVERLLTPWLGNKVDISILPIPQLLDIKLKSDAEINYDEITRGLHKVTPNASIDNHRLWLNKLLKFASSLRNIALAILFMVAVICAFSIYYSARTSLGINSASIEILHIVGAYDDFIARQYARNYAKIGFFAGIIGLMVAVPCILLIGRYGLSTGSGLLNGASLSGYAWTLIMITPVFSFFYAMMTSYYTVRKTLEKMF